MKLHSQLRDYVMQRLAMKGHGAPIADDSPLFSSGLFDSLDAVEMIMYLEEEFGINFADINFDLTLLDSIDSMAELIDRHQAATSGA